MINEYCIYYLKLLFKNENEYSMYIWIKWKMIKFIWNMKIMMAFDFWGANDIETFISLTSTG